MWDYFGEMQVPLGDFPVAVVVLFQTLGEVEVEFLKVMVIECYFGVLLPALLNEEVGEEQVVDLLLALEYLLPLLLQFLALEVPFDLLVLYVLVLDLLLDQSRVDVEGH